MAPSCDYILPSVLLTLFKLQILRGLPPPAPDERISALCLEPEADLILKRGDPAWMHKMVYERARRLKREQHYDFTQWSDDGPNWERSKLQPEPPVAYLLLEQHNIAVGVAAFVFMHWEQSPPSWHLLFVWVARMA